MICIILMLWGIFLILGKCISILQNRYLFDVDLLEGATGDTDDLASVLNSIEDETVRKTLLASEGTEQGGLPTYTFDIHLQGEKETAFFEL